MKRGAPALDRFRLLAAVLVVCNHTAPLSGLFPAADFVLTRVLARTAVPFFLMVSGYFLAEKGWRTVRDFWKKTAALYGVCILLYLPLNLYAGQLHGDFLRRLLADGTFYHLWYFPGLLLGLPIARALSRLGLRTALLLAGALYLIGLGGDSYYGLVSRLPALEAWLDRSSWEVTLEGDGIDAQSLPHIFERFYRADQSRDRKTGGTGLGLAIARYIAERHGGWLEVLSRKGVGTRMTLVLPLASLPGGEG